MNAYLKNLFSFIFLQKIIVYFSINYFKSADSTTNIAIFATSFSMIVLLLIILALSPKLMSNEPRPTFAYLLITIALCFVLDQSVS